jgi:hypothetical protein
MVVKKGNHPPLKIVVSYNDKRGAFPPEVARPMFDAVCAAPAVQLDLILFEALRMQNLSFNVGIDVVVLNTSNPHRGICVRVCHIGVVIASRVVKR